ncbi:unnamed protein product [Notodromas monacha]|uniref:Uncharacterized protein n=1 Tax=Notodromas monacha TaxID=399045 RepID=A0A7R9BS77_9CRUS|nr:unnamed protein product [Notodromas monacha]CAG0919339.1 unnamed protein product [Notodromas monacha]
MALRLHPKSKQSVWKVCNVFFPFSDPWDGAKINMHPVSFQISTTVCLAEARLARDKTMGKQCKIGESAQTHYIKQQH